MVFGAKENCRNHTWVAYEEEEYTIEVEVLYKVSVFISTALLSGALVVCMVCGHPSNPIQSNPTSGDIALNVPSCL